MYLREHFLLVWGYKCSKLFIPPFFHLLQKKYVPQWHHILRWNSALRIRIFWSACKDGRAPFLLSVNTSWLFSVSLTDIFSFSEPQQRRFYPVTQCCKILLYAGMQDFCLIYLLSKILHCCPPMWAHLNIFMQHSSALSEKVWMTPVGERLDCIKANEEWSIEEQL